jgi:hypothetical protein
LHPPSLRHIRELTALGIDSMTVFPIIDGKVVMRGRQVTTVSERQVPAEASKALARVAGAIGWGR